MMKNVLLSARAVLTVFAILVGCLVTTSVSTSVASADPSVSAFYLAIGGSASLGVQPTIGYPKGQRTDDGYTDYLVAAEAAKGVTLELHQIGCSGETTNSMLHGGDKCYTHPDTQLNEAITFLRAHQTGDGLVTVDLGFNDLLPCIRHMSIDSKCVSRQLDTVRQQLTQILGLLKDVAGPNVKFIGVGHYDPYLAESVIAPGNWRMANGSLHIVRHLDEVLSTVYSSFRIPIADVGDAFKIDSSQPVELSGVGTVPENVANVCLLTWMCQPSPLGPNIHPNDAGYQTIATAIEGELTPWDDSASSVTQHNYH
jgi:lysophospholipase L1-like esterase